MTTGVEICANALIRLGAVPIQSFEEETDLATICKTLYPGKAASTLSSFPWAFSFKYIQLSRSAEPPSMQWDYQFALPVDRLLSGVLDVYTSSDIYADYTTDYIIVGDKLMSNDSSIFVKYQYRVDESLWPSHFIDFMIQVMVYELAYPVTENSSLKNEMYVETYGLPSERGGGGMFSKITALDSRDNPPYSIVDDILLNIRA